MKPVIQRPVPMRDQAYDTLKAAIFSGELAPGTIISERELCEQLGISRTPAREAMRRLELEGFIIFSPRQGAIIQNAPTASPEELFTLLGVLEGLAARWAASRHTDEQLAMLQTILKNSETNRDASVIEIHQEMIDAIVAMAQSDRLQRMLAPLHEFRSHMMAVGHLQTGRPKQAITEHWLIYRAIADRDAQHAETLVRTHLDHSLQAYMDGLKFEKSPPLHQDDE